MGLRPANTHEGWLNCRGTAGRTLLPMAERVPHLLLYTGGLYQGTPSVVPLVTPNRAALAATLGDQGLESPAGQKPFCGTA